ncbi:uncharacterized protein LOC122027038 isoform X2 [Zingiber officinale]|uniref:uncharacterized protein LOC122027038 isoform X2 n=1 Tax=Zingiber officinale TaxID=94328 RepID=UPI001C4B0D99|nr:uncharacterized protein LOC122027038 isoform X2 [Zingiber officinale]
MEKDSSFSRGSEMSLLEQFEGILEGDKLIASSQENSDHLLEDEILKHTKALLVLSCNFSSAWNDRWIQDSRDQYTKERLDSVIDQYTKRLDSVTTVLF